MKISSFRISFLRIEKDYFINLLKMMLLKLKQRQSKVNVKQGKKEKKKNIKQNFIVFAK